LAFFLLIDRHSLQYLVAKGYGEVQMEWKNLIVEPSQTAPFVTVTLNRPECMNALDESICNELLEVIGDCADNDQVRAVVFTGEGAAFCAGGDLKYMAEALMQHSAEGAAQVAERIASVFNQVLLSLRALLKPVVMAINGICSGGGTGLALAGDVLLASKNALFYVPQTRIGLAPDGGTSYFITRMLGRYAATELFFAGGSFSAEEAMRRGIVSRVVSLEELLSEAHKVAERLCKAPQIALSKTKKLVESADHSSLEEQLEHERKALSVCAREDEFRKGLENFLAKRTQGGARFQDGD
jgi:2-(1,2-epoxy-1,2-dihydrophenyl)acetyl-CoA isomerase